LACVYADASVVESMELIVIVFVLVLVLMVMLLPATKDRVSEALPANIRELFELIVSNDSWL